MHSNLMRSTGLQFAVHNASSTVGVQSPEFGSTLFAVLGDKAKAELLIQHVQWFVANDLVLRKDAYLIVIVINI